MLTRLERYDGVFDSETVRILTAAFDDAWNSIQKSGTSFASQAHADATREIIALHIIDMARLGERDQSRLCDDALRYLSESNLKSSGL